MKKIRILVLLILTVLIFSAPAQAASYRAGTVTGKQIVKELKKNFKLAKIETGGSSGVPNDFRASARFNDKKYKKYTIVVKIFDDAYDAASYKSIVDVGTLINESLGAKKKDLFYAFRVKTVCITFPKTIPLKYAKKYYTALKKIVK